MQTLGIIDIVWRGQKLDVEKGATVLLGGLQNAPVTFSRKVGRSQEFVPSEITAVVPFKRGDSIVALFGDGEGELQVLCDTGQSFVWQDAFITSRPKLTGGEGGKNEMKWIAGDYEELVNE